MSEIEGFGQIGELTADLMTRIEESVEETHVDLKLGVVGLVVEINYYDEEHEAEATMITFRCSDPRKWVQSAIFDRAAQIANDED